MDILLSIIGSAVLAVLLTAVYAAGLCAVSLQKVFI